MLQNDSGNGHDYAGIGSGEERKAWGIGKFDNHLLFAALWRIVDQ